MAVTLTTPGASGDNRRRTSLAPPGNARVLLVFSVAILALLTVPSLGATIGRGAPANSPLVFTITIKVVRTGAATASVLGTSDALSLPIDVLVCGTTAKSAITMYNGDYWFLGVPVSDGS